MPCSAHSHLLLSFRFVLVCTGCCNKYHRLEANGTPLQYSCLENPMDGGAWWAAVHGVAKCRTRLSYFTFTFHFRALEKEMATHSSVLAWRIPGTGESGGLPSMGSHRVRHDWSDAAAAAAAAVAAAVAAVIPWSSHSQAGVTQVYCLLVMNIDGFSFLKKNANDFYFIVKFFFKWACGFIECF